MAPKPGPSSSSIAMDQPVILPLTSVFDKSDHPPPSSVAALLKLPGLHSDCAAVPIIQTKCIMCNKHAGTHPSTNCKCQIALYCSKNCNMADAGLHQLLCNQANKFRIAKHPVRDRVQVIILRAKDIKAEFALATVTDTGLEIDHPAINTFKSSQKELVPVPDLVNYQLRNFKLTKWLGHGVLLWTLVNWAELPMDWVNRTAMFMGGKAGHTNLFYGPLIISVFQQDMVDPNERTLDHAQMRALRQVADYIQMVDDNPCVANPARFESVPARMSPEPDLAPIPGVKINDKAELELMTPFGMKARMEEVSVAISCRRQEQCPAAVPFVLGLKWYARSANLDVRVEKWQVADRIDENLAWFQWALESESGQHSARARYAHHDRSLVIVQAGGAPLRSEHIDALTMYLGLNQATEKDRAQISKEGFEKYWEENYDPPSPYDLESFHLDNLVEDDADEMMALVAKNKGIRELVMNIIAVRVEVLVMRLIETYPENEQVVRVIETLISYCIDRKSLEDMRAEVVSAKDLEAVRVVEALTRTHTKPELRRMAENIKSYEKGDYLSWFERPAVA